MSTKVVYITGCLGFIGSYVTRKCLDKGWYVKGVDKITYAANTELLHLFNRYKNFSFIHADINDIDFLYDCDYIINTAAETHVGNSIVDSTDFIKSNISGVYNLLELIRSYRTETGRLPILLHFSTDEVYGDIISGSHTEVDILKPSNPYSATKAAADMLIQAWARTYDIPYIIVRPTNNYGIGQYIEKLVPKSIKYLNLKRKIPLHNNGTPIRNWLHAKDTANAIDIIIESGLVNQIYNISGNLEQSNIDTVKKIIQLYFNKQEIDPSDLKTYIDFDIKRSGQDLRYALDDTKLKQLGWKPIANFDNELELIIDYYRNEFIW
jgi:dTDP-glucose 4,6-dehydratase